MQEKLELNFNIQPKPIQSVRGGRNGFFQPKSHKIYKDEIRKQAKEQLPSEFQIYNDAIYLCICFCYELPKNKPKRVSKEKWQDIKDGKTIMYKKTNPDILSNLEKGTLDALTGTIYEDDKLIVKGHTTKIYHNKSYEINICIESLAGQAM